MRKFCQEANINIFQHVFIVSFQVLTHSIFFLGLQHSVKLLKIKIQELIYPTLRK